jgi:hypothetical protein
MKLSSKSLLLVLAGFFIEAEKRELTFSIISKVNQI